MVLPQILGGAAAFLGGQLFGSGGTGGEFFSPQENVVGLGSSIDIDRSTESQLNLLQNQPTSLLILSPTESNIIGSPNSNITAEPDIQGTASPSQSATPIFIPTGAGGESVTGGGSAGGGGLGTTLLIAGAVGLGVFLFTRKGS